MASVTGNAAEVLAAHWAEQAVYATWAAVGVGAVSLVISVIAVVLVRQQLELNRVAIQDAARSADAATSAARASSMEVRPWLKLVHPPRAQLDVDSQGKDVGWFYKLTIENIGRAPALKAFIHAVLINDHTPVQQALDELRKRDFVISRWSLFPGETRETKVGGSLQLSPSDLHRRLYIVALLRYSSHSGTEVHETPLVVQLYDDDDRQPPAYRRVQLKPGMRKVPAAELDGLTDMHPT